MSKKQELIHFRKWIKDIGIMNASKLIGCTYECCRNWVNDGAPPQNSHCRKILKLSNYKVDPMSFFK